MKRIEIAILDMQEAYRYAFLEGAPKSVLNKYLDWIAVASAKSNRRRLRRWVARERRGIATREWRDEAPTGSGHRSGLGGARSAHARQRAALAHA